jgi:hypothetical protein
MMKLLITVCLLSLTLPAVVSLLSRGAIAIDHPVRKFATRVFSSIAAWARRTWWLGVVLIVLAVLSKVPPFIAMTPALVAAQKATAAVGLSFPLSVPIPVVPPFINLGFWGVFFVLGANSSEALARATISGLAIADPSSSWEWWTPAPLRALGVPDLAPEPLVLPLLLSVLASMNVIG